MNQSAKLWQAAALVLLAGRVWAGALGQGESAEDKALDLANLPAQEAPKPSGLRLFFEGAATAFEARAGLPGGAEHRLSLDSAWQASWGGGWSTVLSDRLDLFVYSRSAQGEPSVLNTLRQAYVSKALYPLVTVDVGRINVSFGQALGYNPTS